MAKLRLIIDLPQIQEIEERRPLSKLKRWQVVEGEKKNKVL